MLLKTIEYRKGIKLFDIVTIDELKYIVIEINYERILLEPLTSWIMRNSFMICPESNGAPITITDYVRMKEEKFLRDRDKGLSLNHQDVRLVK